MLRVANDVVFGVLHAGLGHALCDLACALPARGSSSAAVERAVLAAAGGYVKSLSDHCYSYHYRRIFSDAESFAGCSARFQQAARVFRLLFVLPYLPTLSPLQQAVLALCAAVAAPLVKQLCAACPPAKLPETLAHPTLYLHSLLHFVNQVRF